MKLQDRIDFLHLSRYPNSTKFFLECGAKRLLESCSVTENGRMEHKVKRRNFPCIFNSLFILASPLVQSDCSVY